jgi:hypothetical protein
VLAAACVLFAAGASAPAPAAPDEPPPARSPRPGADEPPLPIIVNGPNDLGALLKALTRPDFVILRGDEYDRLRRAGQAPASRPATAAMPVIVAVSVRGTVRGDLAELTVDFRASLPADGPAWVAIRLDGQTLTGAREGDRELPVRVAQNGAWQVELSGARRHDVRVGVLTRVRVSAEGQRLELAIPEAASTRFAVDVPQRVGDAQAGPGEPVDHAPDRQTGLTRLCADLAPRSTLAVVWKVEDEAGVALPPLLVAQGEIAVDVEPGTFRTRSSWSLRSRRGTARSLQLLIDPADEVLELELDGQSPPAGREQVGDTTRMTIPLTDPLGPGEELRLVMTTRRPLQRGASSRVAFRGFPFVSAQEQTGVIGVAQGGDLWVSGNAGRGVRPIDPRFDLPDDLRARPATVRAYQFTEQPFELALAVEPSPPQVRAEARTTVLLEPGAARVDTWLDFQQTRGRLYDVTLVLPPGFRIETVGPDDVVGSWQTGTLPSTAAGGPAIGPRLLAVRLDPRRVQEGGRFSIHVAGRQAIDASTSKGMAVGLIQPPGAASAGGRIAVLTDPSLTAELADPSGGPGAFRPAAQAPPADWPWPPDRPRSASAPMLWLRYDESPDRLRLRVITHPLSLKQSTSLLVRVDRREADVQQETEFTVRFGALDHLDVTVPAALEGRWEVDRSAVVSRTDLGRTPQGDHAFRLNLAAELTRSVRLRFLYQLLLPRGLDAERPATLTIPWVRPGVSAEEEAPVRATVNAEPGLAIVLRDEQWAPAPDGPGAILTSSGSAEEPNPAQLVVAAEGAQVSSLGLGVSVRALADLPKVVVPRLGVRTVQTTEGELLTTAWAAVDTREPALSVVLPPGAVLHRVSVAGEAVRQVEQPARGQGMRIRLPGRVWNGPLEVALEYSVPRSRAGTAWAPPVLEGAVVEQTFWEVQLPWSRALVGVPGGWSDENEWYWDVYVWKRRPWRDVAELSVGGAGAQGRWRSGADARPGPGDDHSYLFSRAGAPTSLTVFIVPRAWLVAVCSGSVLAVGGFFILVWRPSVKLVWVAGLVLGLSVAALTHPSVTFLAVQSGMVGLLLTALVALMQRAVEGRRSAAYSDPSSRTPSLVPGSSLHHTIGAGSDDSTAIRARPVSTMDYVSAGPPAISPQPPEADGSGGRSSFPERVGQGGAPP